MRLRFCFSQEELLRGLTFFLIVTHPLDQLFPSIVKGIPIPSPFKLLMLLYLVFVFVNRGDFKELYSKDILFAFFSLTILSFVSTIWAKESRIDSFVFSFQLLILLCFTFISLKTLAFNDKNLKQIIYYLVIISGVLALLSIKGLLSPNALRSDHRITFYNLGLNAIAISMGYSFILGFTSLFLFNFKKERLKIIIIMVSLFFIYLLIFRLGTRSVVYGLFISVFIAIVLSFNFLKVKYFLIIIGVAIISSIIFTVTMKSGLIEGRLAARVSNFDFNVLKKNDRIEVWKKGIFWTFSHPLGTGSGNEYAIYPYKPESPREAHNTFISAFIQNGFLGLLILSLSFFYIINKSKVIRDRRLKFVFNALLIFFLLQLNKGSMLQTRLFWQPIVFLLLIIEHQKSVENKIETLRTNQQIDIKY